MNQSQPDEFFEPLSEVPVVLVPCPIQQGEFAGWERQFRSVAKRNGKRVAFKFIYYPTSLKRLGGFLNNMYSSLIFAWRCRKEVSSSADKVTVLFPTFFLQNVLVSVMLPARTNYFVRISGAELERGNRVSYALRLRQIRRAAGIIALTKAQYNKLEELDVERAKRNHIPVTIGAHFRKPSASERVEARETMGIGTERFVIGCVGLLSHRKQQKTLIQAVAKSGLRDAIIVLCGPFNEGSEADPQYANECEQLAERLGVRLVFTGRLDDVRPVLWALDLFVLPSLQEGMPNALLEALACGVPSVGSDIPGISELLNDGEGGTLFDPGDVSGLARRIQSVSKVPITSDYVQQFRPAVLDEQILSVLLGVNNKV